MTAVVYVRFCAWGITELVAAKTRVLGIGRERRGTFVRRVVVRGDEDRSLRETARRRIAVEDIAITTVFWAGMQKTGRFVFWAVPYRISAISYLCSIKNALTSDNAHQKIVSRV